MKGSHSFRYLLLLLPQDFRSRYWRDIESVFREQKQAASTAPAVAGLWMKTLRDLFVIGGQEHMQQLKRDFVYALRNMRQRPGFAIAAVLTLAIGIGLNVAMFSVLYSVLLRPLSYPEPDGLVAVWNQWEGEAAGQYSDPEYLDLSDQSKSMTLAASASGSASIGGERGDAERVASGFVTANVFQVLRVAPVLGRSFLPEEESSGRSNVVILSDALWRRHFHGSPDVIGETLLVDAVPHTIVGVLPASLRMPSEYGSDDSLSILLPLNLDRAAARNKRGGHYLRVVGRLRDGVDVHAAAAELANFYREMKQTYPSQYDIPGFSGYLRPLRDDLLGGSRQALLILSLAVGLVLLLACANVANLMIARGEARRTEMAIRLALGASRFRLLRQLMTEGLVLSLAGALVGLALAALCQKALLHWAATGAVQLPRVSEVALDRPVLLFTSLLALLTPLLFGLLPALPATRTAITGALGTGSRGGTGSVRMHTRRALMAAQVTIATVLLIASGLLLKSFVRVLQQPSGIQVDHVLTFRTSLPEARYPGLQEVSDFYTHLLDRVGHLPGVERAGASSGLPMAIVSGDWSFDVEGRPSPTGRHPGKADWYVVTPGYFEALSIGLVKGRLLRDSDDQRAAPVIFLNETSANSLFPNENPVGKRIRLTSVTGAPQPWRTIAGVVHDVRQQGLDTPPHAEMFIPHTQFLHFSAGGQVRSMTIVVRSAVDPLALMPEIHNQLTALDPLIPAAQVQSMDAVVSHAVADRRMIVDLIGAFGLLALLLALIGVYGVMAYTTLQRTREIGVRMALGASGSNVRFLILKDGMQLVFAGTSLGLLLAAAFGRVLASLLFEVNSVDVPVFAICATAITILAAAAIYLPARRASVMDPMAALRVD